ncbi:MAG: M48 family metallopeptidase [Planctomycetota bacterium]|jgi:predicted metal-dependent hydrolase
MTKQLAIDIPNLGPILLHNSLRAKHLSITIKPNRTVRVAIPKGVSLATAKKFLNSKIPWIKKHLNKLKQLQQNTTDAKLPPINRYKARIILAARLNRLAKEHGFKFNKFFLRNQKTRWGTCSGKNNISLNMNLIRLPLELQDYVILHELAHIKYKNHSKKFWAHLDKYVGDAKTLRKKMKNYRLPA